MVRKACAIAKAAEFYVPTAAVGIAGDMDLINPDGAESVNDAMNELRELARQLYPHETEAGDSIRSMPALSRVHTG